MKKFISLAIIALVAVSSLSVPVFADSSEKAQVIKFDKDTNDLIVKRQDGQRWLIQYNRSCTSISTEFPVTIIKSGDKMVSLKVNFNEICKIYNAVPYSGEGKLVKAIRSQNQLVTDHEAEIIYGNNQYFIDYRKGCRYLYDFEDREVYYHFTSEKEGTMVLPGNRGQCDFTILRTTDTVEPVSDESMVTLEGLQFQPQNNQVYFYWKAVDKPGKWLYILSYSRNELELDAYKSWREMPNRKIARSNSYNLTRLENGRQYYIYLTALDEKGNAGAWSKVITTPVAGESVINNPDPETFEVKMTEKDGSYHMAWPAKTEDTRRYYLRFYVNGKFKFFKILNTTENFFDIPIQPEYAGQNLKVTVATFPKLNHPKYSDGIFWTVKSQTE